MTSIFVAKLDFGVDNQQLQALFEQYGKVSKATVALDRETGKSRGFGFVEMFNNEEAQEAIRKLDGYEVNGRPIAVKEAEDRGGSKPAPRRDGPPPRREFNSPPPQSRDGGDSDAPSYIPDIAPLKEVPKKKLSNRPKTTNYEPPQEGGKKTKLNPYKKSGKDNIKIDDDELDEDFDLFGRNEDDELDEDYSKYLVNADDDDEEYDDDDFDDDEYDDEYDDEDDK
jgi:RNA recognition motif-containing protein